MADRLLCGVSVAVAVVYLYATLRMPSLAIGDPLGPRAFPFLITGGWTIATVLLLLEASWRRHPSSRGATWRGLRQLWPYAGVIAWTALYYSALPFAGYRVATAGYLLGLLAFLHPNHWLANVAIAAGFSAASYALFTKALGVPLPLNVLSF